MDLIILRHGEAGNRLQMTGKDAERPLTAVGREEVEDVAKGLGRLKVKFDKIVTSPLRRAQETANIVSKVLNREKSVEIWEELKPEGDRAELYKKLSRFRQDSGLLVVGHEPYLSTLIGELISGTSQSRISLKKAGLARVSVISFTPKASGELRWLLTPKQMRKIA